MHLMSVQTLALLTHRHCQCRGFFIVLASNCAVSKNQR